jgi:signal transduction histidine kinase
MTGVSRSAAWRTRWADRGRRFGAAPLPPAAAGAVLGLLALAEAGARAARTSDDARFDVALCLIALATTLPLALLGPTGAALAVTAATVVSLALFHTLTVAGFAAQLIALYGLGRSSPQRVAAPLLAGGLALPFLVLAFADSRPAASEERILTVLLASLAPAAGWAGFARTARTVATVDSIARQALDGSMREHMARRERARIARELHDVVAHHISMVAVQAETARLTTPGMPAAGAERLSAIGDTARAALTEMRRLLGVLREDTLIDRPARRPQPGLKQLNTLLDEARTASGTGIRLIVQGSPVDLDPGVELAAYRIVQEGLSNARRHAPGAAVDVELHFAGDVLRVRIRDNGPGPPPDAGEDSHGLPGMRERAVAVGGELRTGRAAVGGFVVEATLPADEVPG